MPLFASLFNFAQWMTRDAQQAEDLVQETFLKAFANFGSFKPGTNFRAWIFRILRNAFLTARMKKRPSQFLSFDDEEIDERHLPRTNETPESLLISGQRQEQIRRSLEKLPPNFREVILLCDVEEMKYQEIAELLDIPVGTVMSRIARGRKILRGILAGERMGV